MPFLDVRACRAAVQLEQHLVEQVLALPGWDPETFADGELAALWHCDQADGHSDRHVAFLEDLDLSEPGLRDTFGVYWLEWAPDGGAVSLAAAKACPADIGEPGVHFDPDQDSAPCHLRTEHPGPHWGPMPGAEDGSCVWWLPAAV